jgi:hypothetical protein
MASFDQDPDDPVPVDRPVRGVMTAVAALLVLVVAAAIVLPTVEARATAPRGPTAAAAEATVRQFLDAAVVQGNGYAACGYLRTSEQATIAALGDPGAECREVLGTGASFGDVATASQLDGLRLVTTVHGSTATVTVPGLRATTFHLAAATAAEQAVPGSSTLPWRIAQGAQRLVPGQR